LGLLKGQGSSTRKCTKDVVLTALNPVSGIPNDMVTATIRHAWKGVNDERTPGMVPKVGIVVATRDTAVEIANKATRVDNCLVFETMAFVIAIIH
jgi:hypothetical protein